MRERPMIAGSVSNKIITNPEGRLMMSKNKADKLAKGAPAGLLVSVAIHAALLILGGLIVVVTIVRDPDPGFDPAPPVEIKEMKLKHATVKVKPDAKPKPTKTLMTKVMKVSPEISLPVVSGIGTAIDGEITGIDLAPNVTEISVFGGREGISMGNDFKGTFYSISYNRAGEEIDCNDSKWLKVVHQFLEEGWNPYVLAPYYKAPQELYTAQIFIPVCYSEYGPSNFGIPISQDFLASYWIVHYQGKIKSPRTEPTRFRFWGMGDDFLPITLDGGKFDNTLVADFSWRDWDGFVTDWKNDRRDVPDDDHQYPIGHERCYVGDWFTLDPGVVYDMNVLLGESWGGHFCAYLMVEEEGGDYEVNRDGLPILPVFRVADMPGIVKDKIQYSLIRGEADLDSELMFNVH